MHLKATTTWPTLTSPWAYALTFLSVHAQPFQGSHGIPCDLPRIGPHYDILLHGGSVVEGATLVWRNFNLGLLGSNHGIRGRLKLRSGTGGKHC